MTMGSLRWLFHYCEVVHFNDGRIINLNRRKKGKEKVRTWKKLRSKLMGSFPPLTYMLKHVPLLHKKNGSKSSCMDVHFNKGSPKISCTLTLPTMLSMKELMSYEDEEEKEDGLNPLDPPSIFDDYGDEEILGV